MNPASPSVTVITPAYNAAARVGETIRSVQAQSLGDWEMLIADDASEDATAALVEEAARADPRITLIRCAANGGSGAARNAALSRAKGRYIAFLDSDDLWLPEKLARQTAFMVDSGCALSYTAFRRISADGQRTGRLIHVPDRLTYQTLLKNTAIATLTAMVDSRQTGPLTMSTARRDDYILWLSLLRRGFVARGLNEDLARYRAVAGSLSSRPGRSAAWTWRVYREAEGLGPVRASWCMANYGARALVKRLRF